MEKITHTYTHTHKSFIVPNLMVPMVPLLLNSHQCSIKTALSPRFLFQNIREKTTKERYPHLISVPKSLLIILFVILGQEIVTELVKEVSGSQCRLTLKSK